MKMFIEDKWNKSMHVIYSSSIVGEDRRRIESDDISISSFTEVR